jgi:hypothetical protein
VCARGVRCVRLCAFVGVCVCVCVFASVCLCVCVVCICCVCVLCAKKNSYRARFPAGVSLGFGH